MLTRTNSESLVGAIAPGRTVDYSRGVAITSSFHPDEHTHIEPVRYGRGSNAMSLLPTVLTDGDGDRPRWRTWLRELGVQRKNLRRLYDLRHWSERTVIALVMQTVDNSITRTASGTGRPVAAAPSRARRPQPDLDPGRQRGGPADARKIDGMPGGAIGELSTAR